MTEYKIGDRVVIKNIDRAFENNIGAVGTVFDIKDSSLVVEWDRVSVTLTSGQIIDKSFVALFST